MADLTYSDSAFSIQSNAWFRSRVQVATSKFSNYLINTPDTDADQAVKIAYGQRLAQTHQQIVDQLMFILSGDSEVLTAGPAIPDADLQSIVEKMIGKLYPMQTTVPPGMMYGTTMYQRPPM